MSNPRNNVKRNVLASWFAHAVTIAIGFKLMPFLIETLGQHQYGTWVFINSFASYAALLYFGFGETIARYVSKHQALGEYARVNEIISLVFAFYSAMAGVTLLLGASLFAVIPWLGTWAADELLQVRIVIVLLTLNIVAGLLGSVFGGVLIGMRRFDLERMVSFGSDILRLVLLLVFLQRDWGIVTVAGVYLGLTIVEQIVYVVMAYRVLPQLRLHWSLLKWSVFRECSSFSSMAFLNNLASQLIYATDSIVIGVMLGVEAITPYNIALRLTQFIRLPIDKISHICMPTAGAMQAAESRAKLHQFLIKAVHVTLLLIAGVYIGAWYFGRDLIHVWMHRDFPDSYRLLTVLLAAQIIALPTGVLRAFLFGSGIVRVPALIYLLEALCNLGLSIALCHFYGTWGVALGTVIPVMVFELGIIVPYALHQLGVSRRRMVREAVLPLVPPLLALWGYSAAIDHWTFVHSGLLGLCFVTAGGGAVLGVTWLIVDRFRRDPDDSNPTVVDPASIPTDTNSADAQRPDSVTVALSPAETTITSTTARVSPVSHLAADTN